LETLQEHAIYLRIYNTAVSVADIVLSQRHFAIAAGKIYFISRPTQRGPLTSLD
jgi:hypothetical protein